MFLEGVRVIDFSQGMPFVLNEQVYRLWAGGLNQSETLQYSWIDEARKQS